MMLRPLEIAHGMPIGPVAAPPLARQSPARTPRDALGDLMVAALSRPPCLVSFSGGRDSSALLAVATEVARRNGLALPVPATLVFPESEPSNEDEWQAAVLEHLRLPDWVRIEIHDELDAIGPVATAAFERHGLLWPFNAHFHIPILERAAGGTVVTGFAGDELARSSVAARAERLLTRWERPRLSSALIVGLALSPRPVRRGVHRRRERRELQAEPWLTPFGLRSIAKALGANEARLPLGWEAQIRQWVWRDRYFHVCVATFATMGQAFDVTVHHPFYDGQVLDSLASAGGFRGFGNRTQLMSQLFGDLLPEQVIQRRTKASFTSPLWTNTARTFAAQWSGSSMLTDLVDDRALQAHWRTENPNLLSTTLLQAAWMRERSLPLVQ
jgi:asparagine synthetase B (glutamine-hydrolysing)